MERALRCRVGLSMGKLRFWLAFAALAAVVSGGVYYFAHISAGSGASGTASARPADLAKTPSRAIAVEAARVTLDTVVEELQAVGTLRPNEAVTVAPEIAGRIERIAFREGQTVGAGDVLVELDASILRAELAKARSDLVLARANRERTTTLAGQGMGTMRARDEALAAFQAAEANLALAEARLQKATLRAPLSGIVGLRAVSVGAYVAPGERIVELTGIHPIKLDFRVPELALSSVRRGQRVRITLDALPGRVFEGEIYAIDPVVDIAGRAIRLRARIPNPKGELSPGLFARVRLVVERRDNALLVPEAAIFAREDKQLVYRVVDGRAVQTEVVLGKRRPGQVEIRSGLARDALVVTAGHQQIREGARLDVALPAAQPGRGG
ncbi:MAG: efflux RND transporter periplasmic adaptor subunit [Burkholderiales bacterium]